MSDYSAPIRDMQFVLHELLGLEEVTRLEGCGDLNRELVDSILEEAGRFAGEVLAPLNRTGDQQGSVLRDGVVVTPDGFKEAYGKFAENGWASLPCHPDFGGQGLPYAVAMPVQEMWKASNLSFSLCPMLTLGAIEAISHHGSAEQIRTYLPSMVAGRWTGTMNLTEPQAGSDLSAVRTKAAPHGDHYRLSGTKIFITWGEHEHTENIVHLVLARLPDAPEGVKGISLFIVPKFLLSPDGAPGRRNDVRCVSLEHKLGINASPTCVMALGEKEGAVGYLMGEPHRGLEYMFTMMNHARLAVGLEGVAISERAYQQALGYAKERVQGFPIGEPPTGRVPIIRHPDVRRMLLSMKSQIEAMRALAYFAAVLMDKSKRHPDPAERRRAQGLLDLLIPVVKGWCTEQSIEITSTGVQIHGGMGFIEETGAAQHFRDARITAIYEGTTGIQATDLIGRKVGRDGGQIALGLLGEMAKTGIALEQNPREELRPIGIPLGKALAALEQSTRWVAKTYGNDPRAAAAGSVPYLKLFGIVTGGWLLGRAALAAQAALDRGTSEQAFYRGKLLTARFYADHQLSQAAALAHAVIHGSAATLALADEQF